MVLGEAAKRVPPEVRDRVQGIDWRKVAGLRDVIAHGYFGIDDDIVWDVIANQGPGAGRTDRCVSLASAWLIQTDGSTRPRSAWE